MSEHIEVPELLIAATTAVITHQGRTYRIRKGDTVVRRDDPVVQGREKLFAPLTVTYLGGRARRAPRRPVEQATAAPGESRPEVATTEDGGEQPEDDAAPPEEQGPTAENEDSSGDTPAGDPSPRKVKAWAKDAGYEVPPRGRVPDELVAAYKRAHGGGW